MFGRVEFILFILQIIDSKYTEGIAQKVKRIHHYENIRRTMYDDSLQPRDFMTDVVKRIAFPKQLVRPRQPITGYMNNGATWASYKNPLLHSDPLDELNLHSSIGYLKTGRKTNEAKKSLPLIHAVPFQDDTLTGENSLSNFITSPVFDDIPVKPTHKLIEQKQYLLRSPAGDSTESQNTNKLLDDLNSMMAPVKKTSNHNMFENSVNEHIKDRSITQNLRDSSDDENMKTKKFNGNLRDGPTNESIKESVNEHETNIPASAGMRTNTVNEKARGISVNENLQDLLVNRKLSGLLKNRYSQGKLLNKNIGGRAANEQVRGRTANEKVRFFTTKDHGIDSGENIISHDQRGNNRQNLVHVPNQYIASRRPIIESQAEDREEQPTVQNDFPEEPEPEQQSNNGRSYDYEDDPNPNDEGEDFFKDPHFDDQMDREEFRDDPDDFPEDRNKEDDDEDRRDSHEENHYKVGHHGFRAPFDNPPLPKPQRNLNENDWRYGGGHHFNNNHGLFENRKPDFFRDQYKDNGGYTHRKNMVKSRQSSMNNLFSHVLPSIVIPKSSMNNKQFSHIPMTQTAAGDKTLVEPITFKKDFKTKANDNAYAGDLNKKIIKLKKSSVTKHRE